MNVSPSKFESLCAYIGYVHVQLAFFTSKDVKENEELTWVRRSSPAAVILFHLMLSSVMLCYLRLSNVYIREVANVSVYFSRTIIWISTTTITKFKPLNAFVEAPIAEGKWRGNRGCKYIQRNNELCLEVEFSNS